jgi:hypothetical protein
VEEKDFHFLNVKRNVRQQRCSFEIPSFTGGGFPIARGFLPEDEQRVVCVCFLDLIQTAESTKKA